MDTEKIRERRGIEAIAARMFPAEWVRHLTSLPEQKRLHQFYLFWTWMEAMVKARGGGLFGRHFREPADMSHICFVPHPGFQACVAAGGCCPPISDWRTLLFFHSAA